MSDIASPDLLDSIWQSLADATTHRTPFTLGYLGTVDANGAPQVRAVILRAVDPEKAVVHIATNSTSPKVAEIHGCPAVALTVNDDGAGIQLRLTGTAAIVTDPTERAQAWRSFGPHSRHLYASPLTPGATLPAESAGPEAPDTEEDLAFTRFAWVEITVDRIDRLDLSAPGHDRRIFTRSENGADSAPLWASRRVVP